jgi:hypothetical protein
MSPVRQMKINEAKFSHETYKGLVKSKAHRDPVYLMESQRLHKEQQDRYDLTALAGLKRNKFSDFHLEDEEAFEADKINMKRVKQSSKKRKLFALKTQ